MRYIVVYAEIKHQYRNYFVSMFPIGLSPAKIITLQKCTKLK